MSEDAAAELEKACGIIADLRLRLQHEVEAKEKAESTLMESTHDLRVAKHALYVLASRAAHPDESNFRQNFQIALAALDERQCRINELEKELELAKTGLGPGWVKW